MYERRSNEATMMKNSHSHLDTGKADRHVWLMKCPPVVARAMQSHHPPPPPFTSSAPPCPTVAKVIVTVDPLLPNDDSSTQFTMELAGTTYKNVPSCFSMDISKDIIPMAVFSESPEGKLSAKGKIYRKFDMKPHNKNIDDYAKLCHERMTKYMNKSRQVQIIDNDSGMHMRPMFRMVDVKASGTAEKKKVPAKGPETKRTRRDPEEMEKIMFKLFENNILETQFLKDMLKLLCVYNNKGVNQGSYELKPEYKKSEDRSASV
ncbi:general transcription factor IIF subunit 2-like [Dorcoceras hygrometricum]|uniref:General transcription factor IIF subunit 2-like n=1 Tax=Dorcoceras hygrometricum TaxID=472368 RepID=A0A2Z7DIV1_9LAMI|nr:general transcription factor IIF subunit 2-like [Dorcoceras hygrometricum]